MSLDIQHDERRKFLEIKVTGKLTVADYERVVPEIERLVDRHRPLRILLSLHGFHGWTAGALWEDIKFDARHFNDIERLAIVGENRWQKGMATFCKPFTAAEVKYFDLQQQGELEAARAWLEAAGTG